MATILTTLKLKDLVSDEIKKINENLNDSIAKFKTLGALLSLEAGINLINTAKTALGGLEDSIRGVVGEYQNQLEMETRLNTVMATRFGATREMQADMKKTLQAQADVTGYSYEALTNGAQELATYIENMDTLKGLMPVLANMAKQGGVTSEQGVMSYATMLGKVMGGNMGGMSDRGYVFTEEEKAAFKVMSEQERMNFLVKTVNASIGQQAEALNSLNPQSIQDVSKAWDNTRKALGEVIQPFMQFYDIAVMKWKITFGNIIVSILKFIREHIDALVILLGVLGVAVMALAGYFLYLKSAAVAAALSSAAAWVVANLPLLGIIATILAIIAALTLFLVFSDKTFKAVGVAAGVLIAALMNGWADLYNAFAILGEFITNTFFKVCDKVEDLFLSLAQKIIQAITPIAGAIGQIFGQDWDESLNGFQKKLEEIKKREALTIDYGRVQRVSYKEYAAKGGEIGSNISDKFQGAVDKFTSGFKRNLNGFVDLNQQKNENKYDSNGALLVSDKSRLNLAEEYKELLSKRASEKFFIKQSNVTPSVTVNVSSTNSSPNDIRKAVEQAVIDLTNGMTEVL